MEPNGQVIEDIDEVTPCDAFLGQNQPSPQIDDEKTAKSDTQRSEQNGASSFLSTMPIGFIIRISVIFTGAYRQKISKWFS